MSVERGMRLLISPAKKMRVDTDSLPWKDLPCFIEQAEELYSVLRSMTAQERRKLWQCSEAIAAQNEERLRTTDLRSRLTPAILAYEGIQYQYMAPGVFTGRELQYVQEHLRILSGLYGVLRPFDGVTPYRLEMQAKLKTDKGNDLYSYWGQTIADRIWAECPCVINLASEEYGRCVSRYRPEGKELITCLFGEEKDGKVVEKGTVCKMARGEMVRYLAEEDAQEAEKVKGFSRLGFSFSPRHSDAQRYVFLRHPT